MGKPIWQCGLLTILVNMVNWSINQYGSFMWVRNGGRKSRASTAGWMPDVQETGSSPSLPMFSWKTWFSNNKQVPLEIKQSGADPTGAMHRIRHEEEEPRKSQLVFWANRAMGQVKRTCVHTAVDGAVMASISIRLSNFRCASRTDWRLLVYPLATTLPLLREEIGTLTRFWTLLLTFGPWVRHGTGMCISGALSRLWPETERLIFMQQRKEPHAVGRNLPQEAEPQMSDVKGWGVEAQPRCSKQRAPLVFSMPCFRFGNKLHPYAALPVSFATRYHPARPFSEDKPTLLWWEEYRHYRHYRALPERRILHARSSLNPSTQTPVYLEALWLSW